MGGKRKLLDELFRVMPAHRCYVEVFSGGAALFFAKEPSAVEVINDINGDLVNLYRVVKDDDEAPIARLQWLFASRQIFYEYRDFAKNATLSNLERAARFFFIMKNAFGGRFRGKPSWGYSKEAPSKFNSLVVRDLIEQASRRLAGVYVENRSFDELIPVYDSHDTFFYCDPPYLGTAGYGVDFEEPHFRKLADLAKNVKGKILISANDHPVIRKLFNGMVIKEIRTKYTIQNGNNDMPANELLISNYEQDLYDGHTGKTGELFA